MIKVINGKNIIIQNGKIQSEDYHCTFHQFYEDKESILVLYLIIPGITHDSVRIKAEGKSLHMTAFIDKEYVRVFRAQKIEISGELQNFVKTNIFTTEYKSGILKIILVVDRNN